MSHVNAHFRIHGEVKVLRKIALSFVLVMTTALSLSADEAADQRDLLAKSLKTWNSLKQNHQGNYSYLVSTTYFSGDIHKTKVTVEKGKVTQREFIIIGIPKMPVPPKQQPKEVKPLWIEQGKEVGDHKRGAKPKTIDTLYAEARKILQQPLQPHEKRYFALNPQGLLRDCFIIDTRVADDAATKGVRITSISLK